MALTPKLEIRQSQSLLMTPQLRQAINLLQLTNVELNELLEQELTNNPLLEREDEHLNNQPDTALPTIDDYDTAPSPQDEDFQDIPEDYDNSFDDDGSDREGYETNNWDSYYPNKSKEASEDFDYFEQVPQQQGAYPLYDKRPGQRHSGARAGFETRFDQYYRQCFQLRQHGFRFS